MDKYANLSGESHVDCFELGNDRITVQFDDGHAYLYTNDSSDLRNIEQMKSLAIAGRGLNTFISDHVRERYASQLH
ncbi:MAG: hypothetical protein PF483_06640 [Halothiobacillus sp.]|jgi:hypothetical protein|nr:hypothetical protein [Halothiobacillus sp.]